MARFARIVLPGVSHYVIHRGNRRQPIFVEDQDRFFYLRTLADYLERAEVEF